jgi:hypothetical protein
MNARTRITRGQLNTLAVLLNIIILLIGLALYGFYNQTEGLQKEIGSGMVASGLAALILVLYQIASSAVQGRDDERLRVAERVGLEAYYSSRPDFGFGQKNEFTFAGARKIQILELTGATLFGNIEKDDWLRRLTPETTVQILLQDPLHPPGAWTFLNHRDFEEGNAIGSDLIKVYDFVNKFDAHHQFARGGSFELRLSRAMPTICSFRIDDCIYWAPYLAAVYGDRSPHMKVVRGGELFEVLERHFDRLWAGEAGRPVSRYTDEVDAAMSAWKKEIRRYEQEHGRPIQGRAEREEATPL